MNLEAQMLSIETVVTFSRIFYWTSQIIVPRHEFGLKRYIGLFFYNNCLILTKFSPIINLKQGQKKILVGY